MSTTATVKPAGNGRTERDQLSVTLLVVDVVASTALCRALGDVDYADRIERVKDAIRIAAMRQRSVELVDTGDGFIIVFANARFAVAAAAAIVRCTEHLEAENGERVALRCALHSGEVVESRYGFVGLAIHEAYELGNAADAGEVWLSPRAAAQAGCDDAPGRLVELPKSGPTPVRILDGSAIRRYEPPAAALDVRARQDGEVAACACSI